MKFIMWFSKKEDKKTEELEKIKKVLEQEKELNMPQPEETPQQIQESTITAIDKPTTEKSSSAPLFIKLEKYDDILEKVDDIHSIIAGIKEIIKTKEEVERIKLEVDKLLEKKIVELSRIVSLLDRDLVKPGVELFGEKPRKEEVQEDLEYHLSKLQEELESIKKQFGAQ